MDYKNNNIEEGRICLFDSQSLSVEQISEFNDDLMSYEVAATKDKVDYFI